MAEKLDPKETVSFEELLVSNVFEQEALINLLEAKGIITKAGLPVARCMDQRGSRASSREFGVGQSRVR